MTENKKVTLTIKERMKAKNKSKENFKSGKLIKIKKGIEQNSIKKESSQNIISQEEKVTSSKLKKDTKSNEPVKTSENDKSTISKKDKSSSISNQKSQTVLKKTFKINKKQDNSSIIVSRPKPNTTSAAKNVPTTIKKPSTTYSFKKGSLPPEKTTTNLSHNKEKEVYKKKKDSRVKKDFKFEERNKFFKRNQQKNIEVKSSSVPKEISILENIKISELAKKMNLRPNEIISKLMKMGNFATINNIIDSDTAILIADDYNCKVNIVSLYEQTLIDTDEPLEKNLTIRPPVVTIMGHVDHGKTKLLDIIRKSSVVEKEAGGITQHIGAYQVKLEKGSITFLDTPGHEAFTSMRARGASVTDIVVLVVAANDGVMPQTIEAINHAKEAKVPIIVAINKIDLPDINPEKIIEELASHGLQPEDWGGDTIYCKISAKQNMGINTLLEMILLKAETMDLKADTKSLSNGIIIESRLDTGKGVSITVLIQQGLLKLGDPFVAGIYPGKVRAMFSDTGESLDEADLSVPVQIIGSDGLPTAGSPFNVVKDEKQARLVAKNRQEYEKINSNKKTQISKFTFDNMSEIIKQESIQELKIIIKADVDGSKEAIKNAIEKLSTESIKVNVIHNATGSIIESDVILAKASNALIIGFNLKATSKVSILAQKEQVEIQYYTVIYDLIDGIRDKMESILEPEIKEEVFGTLEVKEIFKISKIGNIAGCIVTSGKINRKFNVRVIRDNQEIFSGKIQSLKRMKEDVNQVQNGYECGLLVENFDDFKTGDRIETFQIEKIKRKL